MDFEQLMESYGIWAVFIGSCFEGEMVNTLAGVAGKAGLLPWPWVLLLGWAGTFSATQVWFLGGKYAGDRILLRRPHLKPKIEKASALLDRWGLWIFVFYRYLYGLRTVTPFAIGMAGVSTVQFMLIDGVCWFLWLGTLSTFGYLIGDAAIGYLEVIYVYQKWFLAALVFFAISAFVWTRLRRKA